MGGNIRCKNLDKKLLKKMKKSGCQGLMYGIESGSQRILDLMKKDYNLEEIRNIIKTTHSIGIKVCANFIVGHPAETWSDFYKTVIFLYKKPNEYNWCNCFPYDYSRRDRII